MVAAQPPLQEYSPSDFLYGPTLGEGRFGTVVYAELKLSVSGDKEQENSKNGNPSQHHDVDNQQHSQSYAIKMIPKSEIIRHNQIQAVMIEKYILSEVLSSSISVLADDEDEEDTPQSSSSSELCMKLFLCFHDTNYIYLVLELCAGGTLLDLIQQSCTSSSADHDIDIAQMTSSVMDTTWVQYYACQIVRGIEYLHQRGVIHRDISPQNIGITFPKGEIKLGDFGAAAVFSIHNCDGIEMKRWIPSSSSSPGLGLENSSDFVGTAGYVSPEMIRGNIKEEDSTNQSTAEYRTYPAMDLWGIGCIIYYMLVGKSPFHALGEETPIQNMLDYANEEKQLHFPPLFIDSAEKDLITSLLSIVPDNRIGMQDCVIESFGSSRKCKQYQSIRDHEFFQSTDDENKSIWPLVENKSMEPPFKPIEPDWLVELSRGDRTLQSLNSAEFDF